MLDEEVKILDSDPRLYNEDLAPIPFKKNVPGDGLRSLMFGQTMYKACSGIQ
jgi:hypothetical protein